MGFPPATQKAYRKKNHNPHARSTPIKSVKNTFYYWGGCDFFVRSLFSLLKKRKGQGLALFRIIIDIKKLTLKIRILIIFDLSKII